MKLVDYFSGRLEGLVLDIGEKNPLRDLLAEKSGIPIDNTEGDLDMVMLHDETIYDTVLCLDVLEHLFNPLFLLKNIKRVTHQDSIFYVGLPRRGKLLWAQGHYHEIDDYRFRLLAERAGYKIVSKYRYKVWRNPFFYLTGIRPFLRLFFEWGVVYTLRAN